MRALAPMLLALIACKGDDEVQYTRFNGDDDVLVVEVGVSDLLDPVETVLTSSTNEVEVGLAWVDPGGGPVGTDHGVVVQVYDVYQSEIDRVTVRARSPGRGEDEYALTQDSADEGVWKINLTSVGSEGESRSDELQVLLWVARGTAEEDAG
jgi:hypothetical protein